MANRRGPKTWILVLIFAIGIGIIFINEIKWGSEVATDVVSNVWNSSDDDEPVVVEVIETDTTTRKKKKKKATTTTVNYSFTSPSMGAVINETELTIKWSLDKPAKVEKTKVSIEIQKTGEKLEVEVDANTMEVDLPTPLENSNYTVILEAIGDDVVGSSNTYFEIDFTPVFVLLTPSRSGVSLPRGNITFEWESNGDNDKFAYAVIEQGTNIFITPFTNTTSKTVTENLIPGNYLFHVRWKNKPGGKEDIVRKFKVN